MSMPSMKQGDHLEGVANDQKFPLKRVVLSHSLVTDDVLKYEYPGSGTEEDPFRVDWIPNDPRNPLLMPTSLKWFIAVIMSFGTLAVSFASTAFSGCLPQVEEHFQVSTETATLTISLFVLGFAIGPMTWAPLSELYGRQIVYFVMFGFVTVFGAGSIGSQNIQTLVVLRFLAGATGSSSIVNSAGVISDIFSSRERGLAVTVYSSAPFLGPTLGPITGGFLGQYGGWRWVDAMTVIFCGVLWVLGALFVPETYTPTLLQKRAAEMSKLTGKVYKSKLEVEKGGKSAKSVFSVAMTRPWVMLVFEPIVFLLAIYASIIYGILYLIFSAFPIVFESQRGWSQGISGLSFLGVMTGQIIAMFFSIYLDKRYKHVAAKAGGFAPPEARLPPALIGAVILPAGLFLFAWTNSTSIHWMVCMIGSAFFGFGQVLLFISMINYAIDSYTVFAASAMAANAILRAIFGAAFPLFTPYMYKNLGIHWASSVPAFLALACTPFPFLFFKYGLQIRERCKYATEAKRIMESILNQPSDSKADESKDQDQDEEAGYDSKESSTGSTGKQASTK